MAQPDLRDAGERLRNGIFVMIPRDPETMASVTNNHSPVTDVFASFNHGCA